MNKKILFLLGSLLCLALFIAACSSQPDPSTPTLLVATATHTLVPSRTPTHTLTATVRVLTPTLPSATPTQPPPTATLKPTKAVPTTRPVGLACPGAPESHMSVGDWGRVSVDPPTGNRLRSLPGSQGEVIGRAGAGVNLLILEGPECAEGYTWWRVRTLEGLEGWTAEGDQTGYWLVEPISAWYELPAPVKTGKTKTYDLREIRLSPEIDLVTGIEKEFFPLVTPLPTPLSVETPQPDDPRGGTEFGTVNYAAHSTYRLKGAVDGVVTVFDLQDPLSKFFLNNRTNKDCTRRVREITQDNRLLAGYQQPFCGFNGAIPLHFKTAVQPIEFKGGKGMRFLISSANYLTVNKLNYLFQGLTDDGRYYITALFYDIAHPYIVDELLLRQDFGPLLAWKEGQYDQAEASYKTFNQRIQALLEAGLLPTYPSLDVLDALMASIEVK